MGLVDGRSLGDCLSAVSEFDCSWLGSIPVSMDRHHSWTSCQLTESRLLDLGIGRIQKEERRANAKCSIHWLEPQCIIIMLSVTAPESLLRYLLDTTCRCRQHDCDAIGEFGGADDDDDMFWTAVLSMVMRIKTRKFLCYSIMLMICCCCCCCCCC